MLLSRNQFWRCLSLAFALAWLCAAVCGATAWRDYATKLKNVQLALESLRVEESGEPAEEAARSRDIVAYVREELPANLIVDGPDGSFAVNNEWLTQELDAYEELAVGGAEAERQLENITTRLAALRDRVEETQRAAKSSQTAKVTPDEQKGKLESILRRPEFNAQEKPDNAINRLKKRISEWLARHWPRRAAPLSEDQARRLSPLAQVIVYALVLLAFGLAAWRVWPMLRGRRVWSRRNRNVKPVPRVILGETLAPDQTGADIFHEAEELARRGALRAAIRKGYIALLCELGDRKTVRLEQHKTNRDYLRDVAGQDALYRPLRQLTGRFEYHWYGLAPASEQDWDEFRAVYRDALENGMRESGR